MDNGTVISPGTVVNGTVRGRGPLFVQGRVAGRVQLEGVVSVAAKATLQAEVDSDLIEVKGNVKGPLRAREAINIQPGAHIDGDLEAPRIEIDPGARVRGRVVMPVNLPRGVKAPTAARDPWSS